ncbi:MAG: D-alanine--D-alanine ligase [Lentisphaerae bacterium]|jgi:D-alanine-D-alanine ligase|nr:D-alanine--D-alanine ligase [Lentisphaerota bacterium]
MARKFNHIAVLMGGTSSEREVSLRSGQAVVQGLNQAGYQITPVVLDTNSIDSLPNTIDAVFIVLHGGYGENGTVQADLDKRRIPYTGPGSAASRLTINKAATQQTLAKAGLPIPPNELLSATATTTVIPYPVVVKPPCDGSSVGISLVPEPAALPAALTLARQHAPQGEVMVEAYIPGREWTVGVLIDRPLPAVEICAPNGWYDYHAKYNSNTTRYLFADNATDHTTAALCQQLALKAFAATGCRGYSRVDFRVTPEGHPFILEINTVPGFTATSLLPKGAAHAGINFPELCATIIETAQYDEHT